MTGSVRGLRAAFVFFTRVPVGGFPYDDESLSWATAHAPFVGLCVGAVSAAVFVALTPLGSLAAAVFAVGASVWLTGALHEDGLADSADALGGGQTRERIFEILKDSRIGAFGAAALCLSLAARVALVHRLREHAVWALPLAGCAARVGPVWLLAVLPYVSDGATAKSTSVARSSSARVVVATLWCAGAALVSVRFAGISPGRTLGLVAVLTTVWTLSGRVFHRRLGGVTGDFLGAAEQLGEIAALAVLAWN